MSKSLIRFFYDYGGVCFWNEQGAAVTPEQLGLSPETTRKAYELTGQYDASMNWYWDVRLWNQEECDRFNQATRELVEAVRMELSKRFEVVNEQGEFGEDARLEECLKDPVGLVRDDVVGQLRRREGRIAALGSEDGVPKLDWVEGIQRLLTDGAQLEAVEDEARAIWRQGIRHIIWAGMGGSVIAVRVFTELGFCDGRGGSGQQVAIYPLDSTDPAALNTIVRAIAAAKQLPAPVQGQIDDPARIRSLLDDVMMVGVSMGMTSEEPITHLEWFTALLEQGQLLPAEHLLVMTLPGSYLDRFAHEHQVPSRPLQLDGGTGTGGRMSAPTTRVFLLPAALYLTRLSNEAGQLRKVLQQAWTLYNLDLATKQPYAHPFVQLAVALSNASMNGACRMLLAMPPTWQPLVQWIEQLMEESLGKKQWGGQGIVVFPDQPLNPEGKAFHAQGMLRVRVTTDGASNVDSADVAGEAGMALLHQPYLADDEPRSRLAALAASFLGWQLTMAVFGALHNIQFAGQPAVENYKARARVLRSQSDPLQAIADWNAKYAEGPLTLFAPQDMPMHETPASAYVQYVRAIQQAIAAPDVRYHLGYLDFTVNGDASAPLWSLISEQMRHIGNDMLGVPVKLRRAPAAYHSTEQSEMEGPPNLVSLRLLVRDHETSILGTYTDTFLRAQAVGTWQAMLEQRRPCFLLLIHGTNEEAIEPLRAFFERVQRLLNDPGNFIQPGNHKGLPLL